MQFLISAVLFKKENIIDDVLHLILSPEFDVFGNSERTILMKVVKRIKHVMLHTLYSLPRKV